MLGCCPQLNPVKQGHKCDIQRGKNAGMILCEKDDAKDGMKEEKYRLEDEKQEGRSRRFKRLE